MNTAKQIATYLLQSKAIKIEPANPFTWASGWKSPIYCDNRITLSYPEIRSYIKNKLALVTREHWPEAEHIAGVATGAIAQGALVAEETSLPFLYVRPTSKKHGLGNIIEGKVEKGKKVVVIEDLVSTGKSSLDAVTALREAGMNVLGMGAVFTYDFDIARKNFMEKNCTLITLSNYHDLLETALESGYISSEQVDILRRWRENPDKWLQN